MTTAIISVSVLWKYGNDLPEEKINTIFKEYMVTGIIPIWVTYYAKDIVKLDKANVLDSYNTPNFACTV